MSKQFLYAQLSFTHYTTRGTVVTAHQSEVMVEVPKDLVHCNHPESPCGNDEEKSIALEIATVSALSTLPIVQAEGAIQYIAGNPIWHKERLDVMNERRCDQEKNGVRAWRIAGVVGSMASCELEK
jgi:hypothetical protein